ncbi:MAG: mechanosensitive ion channel, partial [Magnetococcales bacterium]|nr:mechanosensitive ion channel [Magnetococcales bacterium]
NIFSGLAINMERPFRTGDIVKIGNNPVGTVLDLGWRTTRIQTPINTVVSIPNHSVGDVTIENFTFPNETIMQVVRIHVDIHHSPDRVLKVIRDGALSVPAIPDAQIIIAGVSYDGVDERGACYVVAYNLTNYAKWIPASRQLKLSIRKHLHHANIPVLTASKQVLTRTFEKDRQLSPTDSIEMVLQDNAILGIMTPEFRSELANKLIPLEYKPGEMIIQAGEKGSSMFVVQEGVVEVSIFDSQLEDDIIAAQLGVGQFFGEMSLLTGEVRSANVKALTFTRILEVRKEDIDSELKANPEFLQALGEVLASRNLANENLLKSDQEAETSEKGLVNDICQRIARFFNLKF